jgi:hypothetical protein
VVARNNDKPALVIVEEDGSSARAREWRDENFPGLRGGRDQH